MGKLLLLFLSALIVFAALGGGPVPSTQPDRQSAATASAPPNPAHTALYNLSDPARNAVLTKFMAQSGEHCVVVKTFFQGFDAEGDAFWNVACRNKQTWLIGLNPDAAGSTRILECEVLKWMAGVECFKKFP